jgi:hypothetical protein
VAVTYSLLEPSASLSSSLLLVVTATHRGRPFLLSLAPFVVPLPMALNAAVECRLPIAQNKDVPDHLIAIGVLGGDIKQLLIGV